MKAWQIAVIVVGLVLLKLYIDATPSTGKAEAQASDALVTVGQIRGQEVDVFVKNIGPARLKSVFLHCTMRDSEGTRIDDVPVLVTNLAPGDSQTETARTTKREHAIRKVECLTEHAIRG